MKQSYTEWSLENPGKNHREYTAYMQRLELDEVLDSPNNNPGFSSRAKNFWGDVNSGGGVLTNPTPLLDDNGLPIHVKPLPWSHPDSDPIGDINRYIEAARPPVQVRDVPCTVAVTFLMDIIGSDDDAVALAAEAQKMLYVSVLKNTRIASLVIVREGDTYPLDVGSVPVTYK